MNDAVQRCLEAKLIRFARYSVVACDRARLRGS